MAVSMHGLDLSFLKGAPALDYRAERATRRPPPRASARSDLPCPRIISDNLEFRSMIDGRMITSRSQYRDHLKRHGYVELGNDLPTPPSKEEKSKKVRKQIKQDLITAIKMHEQGFRNAPLETADKVGITDIPTAGKVARSKVKETILTA